MEYYTVISPPRKPRRSVANGACFLIGSWRKSTYSSYNGDCVEIGSWRKSSYSIGSGQCVEISSGPAVVGVQDSKLGGDSPVLEFSPAAWRAFIKGVKQA